MSGWLYFKTRLDHDGWLPANRQLVGTHIGHPNEQAGEVWKIPGTSTIPLTLLHACYPSYWAARGGKFYDGTLQ